MTANNALPVVACPPGTRVVVWENYGAWVTTDAFTTATPPPDAATIDLHATYPLTHADRVRIRRLFGHGGEPAPLELGDDLVEHYRARARARAADEAPQQWRPVAVMRHPTTWPVDADGPRDMKTPPRAAKSRDGAITNHTKD